MAESNSMSRVMLQKAAPSEELRFDVKSHQVSDELRHVHGDKCCFGGKEEKEAAVELTLTNKEEAKSHPGRKMCYDDDDEGSLE